MRRRLGVLAITLLAAIVPGACGAETPSRDARPPAASGGPSSPPPGERASDGATDPPAPTATASALRRLDLANGRHAAHITDLDLDRLVLTFDEIQWLSEQAARRAYRDDEPSADPGEVPPNEYWVRNPDPGLRLAAITEYLPTTLVDLTARTLQRDVTLAEFGDYVLSIPSPDRAVFWLTVRDGRIVSIEEQYRP